MFQGVPGGSRGFQGVPESSRLFQGVPEGSRVFQRVPGCSRVFQGFPGGSRGFKGFKGVPSVDLSYISVLLTKKSNENDFKYLWDMIDTMVVVDNKEKKGSIQLKSISSTFGI